MVLRKVSSICKVLILQDAPVAQLDRAFDYETHILFRINHGLIRNQSVNKT